MAEFARGARIPLIQGGEVTVIQKLGEGGQGTVYRVTADGHDYALKWYHKSALSDPKRFYNNLKSNIAKGAPTPAFLWPRFLTVPYDGSFGYVMELRPRQYRDFSDFLLAKARFASISAAINAALNITNGFRELHRGGFSYQDLNDGNFFIDPQTGDVLICDNDNVAPYGENLGIAGKARYMAPEVVRNIKRPDCMTDRFSLAVILFRLLFLDHPLEGKRLLCPCLTEELELKYYGIDPVFVYDPADSCNRPVRGVHSNVLRFWPLYPSFIRELFVKAFSKDSMAGRTARISDSEWQIAFTQLRDMLITCPCSGETFVEPHADFSICINCGTKIPTPPVLEVKRGSVVLFPGKRLYRCHTQNDSDDYTTPTAEIIRNVKRPDIWGLRNLTNETWQYTSRDGSQNRLEPGGVAIVTAVDRITFSGCEGRIVF